MYTSNIVVHNKEHTSKDLVDGAYQQRDSMSVSMIEVQCKCVTGGYAMLRGVTRWYAL